MVKPRIQSRVDPHLKRKVDTYAEANDMTQAEAVRYLVSAGLRHQGEEDRPGSMGTFAQTLTQPLVLWASLALLLAALAAFAAAGAVATGVLTTAVAIVGAGLYFAGLALGVVGLLARVATSSRTAAQSPGTTGVGE